MTTRLFTQASRLLCVEPYMVLHNPAVIFVPPHFGRLRGLGARSRHWFAQYRFIGTIFGDLLCRMVLARDLDSAPDRRPDPDVTSSPMGDEVAPGRGTTEEMMASAHGLISIFNFHFSAVICIVIFLRRSFFNCRDLAR